MSKKGRGMTNETDKKLDELLAKFEGVEKRIGAIENQLKSPAPGIGETASPDLLAQMFCGPMMPGIGPMMPGMMPGMMPPAGPFTIWWAWWLSWFLWPFALPLAASGAFPHTSRFAAARAEFFGRWLEAMARMTQRATGPFMGFAPTKPIDAEVVSKLKLAFNQAPLNSLSQEQQFSILWALQGLQGLVQFFQRVRPSR
jgi:hypothetical protein